MIQKSESQRKRERERERQSPLPADQTDLTQVRIAFEDCPKCGVPHDRGVKGKRTRCSRAKPAEPVVSSTRSIKKQASVSPSLSLSRKQLASLYAGEHPRVTTDAAQPCPVIAGEVIEISEHLWLVIRGAKRIKEGRTIVWLIDYQAHGERPRLLRSNVHAVDFQSIRRSFDADGSPQALDGALIAAAAEESAYTSTAAQALAGEPEAISRADTERIAVEAATSTLVDLHALWDRLNDQLTELEDHPDMAGAGSELRFVKTKLEKVRSKIERRIRTSEAVSV